MADYETETKTSKMSYFLQFGDIHFQFEYSNNKGSDKTKKQTQQMDTFFHSYDGMSNKKFPNLIAIFNVWICMNNLLEIKNKSDKNWIVFINKKYIYTHIYK